MTPATPRPIDRHRASGRTKRPVDSLGTLLIVVVLTVLIWIYAERAQNRDETLTLQVALSASDPNNLSVEVPAAGDRRIEISVNGPNGQINLLKEGLEENTTDGRFKVTLSAAESTPGDRTIDLKRLLRETPLFANSGVDVLKTSPAEVGVRVDPLVSREVAVALPADRTVSLQEYRFEPARVTVRGPERLVTTEFAGASPTIPVDLSALRSAADRGERAVVVPVVLPRDGRITVNPEKVRLNFSTNAGVREVKVLSAGILVERPLGDDGRTRVVMRRGPVINNVWLRGPANLVNKYGGDRPDVRLQAVLQVTQADAGKSNVVRRVDFPYLERDIEVFGTYSVEFDVKEQSMDADR